MFKKLTAFIGPVASLPYSQAPDDTAPYPRPDEFSPHPHTLSKKHFNIILQPTDIYEPGILFAA